MPINSVNAFHSGAVRLLRTLWGRTRPGGAALCVAVLAAGTSQLSHAATSTPAPVVPPPPMREFRGAWVASVGNIDWPSQKGLSSAEQQTELLAILDRAVQLRLNAIILQVRPACDALYASRIEPWSEYLTGVMGRAPQPYYDPLAFAIAEAHKRGLELHAWFNPYRARILDSTSPTSADHVSKRRPQLVRHYGKFLWLDPGEKEVQDYSLSVIMDVVKRYDVDGVHFDDYFYPYKEKDSAGKEMDFPDEASWRRYGAHGKMTRDDWRRDNVNQFIERVYRSIKSAKPWVKFGVSPFGIWRPGYPASVKGFDAYAVLYADSRKWLANGWVDYLAPQLYWPTDAEEQGFPALLRWWAVQNSQRRLLIAGLNTAHTGRGSQAASIDYARARRIWPPQEIVNQIRIDRELPIPSGHIHWNMRTLMRNTTLDEALKREVYQQPALMPAYTWLDGGAPGAPRVKATECATGRPASVSWAPAGLSKPWLWLVQSRAGTRWMTQVLPAATTSLAWNNPAPDVVAVSAVDRNGNASQPVIVHIQPSGK
ncbi:MAG TPA: family 10 glycosylhydrolase [Candidatus Acidoferrum sp.]|nr:family 10 glycosylhydrolase [Candidatus Acidoferrum sp.]